MGAMLISSLFLARNWQHRRRRPYCRVSLIASKSSGSDAVIVGGLPMPSLLGTG